MNLENNDDLKMSSIKLMKRLFIYGLCLLIGVCVAAASMGLSHYMGSHVPDALGSLVIASLLGSVASFMIYTNSGALGKIILPLHSICIL
jgi:hypothetical protein